MNLRIKDKEVLFEVFILAEESIPLITFNPRFLFQAYLKNLAKEKTDFDSLYQPKKNLDKGLRALDGKLCVFVGEPREVFPEVIKTFQA
jgi:hypothetical protein